MKLSVHLVHSHLCKNLEMLLGKHLPSPPVAPWLLNSQRRRAVLESKSPLSSLPDATHHLGLAWNNEARLQSVWIRKWRWYHLQMRMGSGWLQHWKGPRLWDSGCENELKGPFPRSMPCHARLGILDCWIWAQDNTILHNWHLVPKCISNYRHTGDVLLFDGFHFKLLRGVLFSIQVTGIPLGFFFCRWCYPFMFPGSWLISWLPLVRTEWS